MSIFISEVQEEQQMGIARRMSLGLIAVIAGISNSLSVPVVLAADGYWQFVRFAEGRPGMSPVDPAVKRSGSAGNVTLSRTWNVHTGEPPYHADQTLSGRISWSSPPRILVPGQLLKFPINGTVLVNSHRNQYSGQTIGAWVRWGSSGSDYFGERRNNRVYTQMGLSVFEGTSTPSVLNISTGSIVLNGVREIPRGFQKESEVPICVGVQYSNDVLEYCYYYAWKEGAVPQSAEDSATPLHPPTTPGSPPAPQTQGPSKEPAEVSAMTLQAGKRQARSGETISVPVYLIRGAGVANMNFNVFYDPRVAIGQGAKKGGLIPSGAPFEQNSGQKGMVRLGFAGNKDFGGTGQVAEILFKIEGKPGVKTPLKLAVTTIAGASGGRPAIATIDGEIEIVEAAASSPQSVPQTPPSTPAAPQQPATPISPAKSGDCNADGRLNSADALCALQMSVGLKPADTQVDMDEDGQVTSSDARLILQKVVGK